MSPIDALRIAKQIASLAQETAPLLTGLVNSIRGHDAATQRLALDAAFTAAEDAIAAKMRRRA